MVICRDWGNGYCRYFNDCKFKHPIRIDENRDPPKGRRHRKLKNEREIASKKQGSTNEVDSAEQLTELTNSDAPSSGRLKGALTKALAQSKEQTSTLVGAMAQSDRQTKIIEAQSNINQRLQRDNKRLEKNLLNARYRQQYPQIEAMDELELHMQKLDLHNSTEPSDSREDELISSHVALEVLWELLDNAFLNTKVMSIHSLPGFEQKHPVEILDAICRQGDRLVVEGIQGYLEDRMCDKYEDRNLAGTWTF
ncbi:hypothetical protein LTS08_003512 [Lithohypha guttulata]|nr:hypothetical protein LTS08_003512 [Lithohypha guttulata]